MHFYTDYILLWHSRFWGRLSIKKQRQNPEIWNNPESFHPWTTRHQWSKNGLSYTKSGIFVLLVGLSILTLVWQKHSFGSHSISTSKNALQKYTPVPWVGLWLWYFLVILTAFLFENVYLQVIFNSGLRNLFIKKLFYSISCQSLMM